MGAVSTTDVPVTHKKRSFLQLPVTVDVERLVEDYHRIPPEAWSSSHWDTHCSSNMVLLRGGSEGTAGDFVSSATVDHDVLRALPYMRWLVGDAGPFGGTSHAFIFRMKPFGVSRPHTDDDPAWFAPFRVHIPVVTNDGAYLLSEGRAKHLRVGEVWTFDNQAKHAVVNGDAVRAHMIFDVQPSARLFELVGDARFDPGSEDPEHWRMAQLPDSVPSMAYATSSPVGGPEKAALGLPLDSFASRIDGLGRIARLTRADLKIGDIVCAVDGVSECAVARTATDYIQIRHRPGETVHLRILRQGAQTTTRLRLYPRRADALRGVRQRLMRVRTPSA